MNLDLDFDLDLDVDLSPRGTDSQLLRSLSCCPLARVQVQVQVDPGMLLV